MRSSSVGPCPGTAVVHRDEAVTCSEARCRSNVTKVEFFEHHLQVVRCVDAQGGSGCPMCGFRHLVDATPGEPTEEVWVRVAGAPKTEEIR